MQPVYSIDVGMIIDEEYQVIENVKSTRKIKIFKVLKAMNDSKNSVPRILKILKN